MKIVSKRRMRRQSVFLSTPPRRKSLTPQRKSETSVSSSVVGGSGMSSSRSPLANVYREIAILKKLSHVNIVQLHEVLDDPMEDELILGT